VILRPEATAADYMAYPEFVEPIRGYAWKNAEIKAALLEGTITMKTEGEQPFARIKVEQRVKFALNKPEKLPPKKKKGTVDV
jgi:hypothetical protein